MRVRAVLALLMMSAALPVAAQEVDIGAAVSVELNAAQAGADGCRLSFLVINGHAAQIDRAVYEAVLFDAGGQVDRLTLFDFGALPAGRPRVRQFSVPGSGCDGLGRILINGAATCEAPDLEASACEADLVVSSRTDIEVQG